MAEFARSCLLEGVPHGFFGRQGGVSTGVVGSLQCGFGAEDRIEDVRANRWIAIEAVRPGGILVTPHQVHSPDVLAVTEPWADDARPAADALVTDKPGLVLGIVTADCAPVLFLDRNANVIGAAHVGWRGAYGGVLENTVNAMLQLGASRQNIAVTIGPASSKQVTRLMTAFLSGSRKRIRDSLLGVVRATGSSTYPVMPRCASSVQAFSISRTSASTLTHWKKAIFPIVGPHIGVKKPMAGRSV